MFRGTWGSVPGRRSPFRLRGYHPLWRAFPDTSARTPLCNSPTSPQTGPNRPHNTVRTTLAGYHVLTVWADSRSLTATREIVITFYSSGYLDVSVHLVVFPDLCIQSGILRHYPQSVPRFGNLRISACLQLPGAYRSLPRPS